MARAPGAPLLAFLCAVLLAGPAAASDADVLALRERVRAAALAHDRAALETLLADSFLHVRDGGRVDLKEERVALLAAGEPAIETVPEDELQLALHGEDAATATGLTRIRDPETSRLVSYRWLAVYARIGGRWRLAASEAHRAMR